MCTILKLQGPLARRAADCYSDIDMSFSMDDDVFEKFGATFYGDHPQVRQHTAGTWARNAELADITNERWFILYADGTQLDCVIVPISTVIGRGQHPRYFTTEIPGVRDFRTSSP